MTPATRKLILAAAGTAAAGVFALWNSVTQPEFAADARSFPHASSDPKRLERHVRALSEEFVPRNYAHAVNLARAAEYIFHEWQSYGLKPRYQKFKAGGKEYRNVIVELGPSSEERVVVGAHYDAFGELPGADDNASGVAGVLELGRLLAAGGLPGRVELVAYCLEEPPHFTTAEMGSAVHARSLKAAGAKVKAMLSLEMIGYFTDEKNSQDFPLPALKLIYPNEGNFIAVAADLQHRALTSRVKKSMRRGATIGVHSINAPRSLPGIDLSDHRSYWEEGYPALMITDTAFYRNTAYHTERDTAGRLDYPRMGQVVEGVRRAVLDLLSEK